MNINEIKSPSDILKFMKDNIQYGWLDINNEVHVGNMQNFKNLYRTSSVLETLTYGVGTCIEQVMLMHTLLDSLKISNKMFCTRVCMPSFNSEEHMHCFVLYFIGDKVYQIEHPDFERIGIYEFASEEEAIEWLNNYYSKKDNGLIRNVTRFYDVPSQLSFDKFREYINEIDENKKINPIWN